MTLSTLILAVLLALFVGTMIGWFAGRARGGSSASLERENSQLRADYAAASQAKELLSERVKDLEERSREDADVIQALAPVKLQLATMEKSVRTMEQQRAEQYGSVSEALKSSARTQEQLRDVTSTLSTALRSSSARGTWGEAQLRRVVEAAGMSNHVAFSEQVSGTATSSHDEEKSIRPDMVIYLPGGKTIVLDAKTPLVSYLNAQDVDEESEKKSELKKHARAVKAHVDALAHKKYWAGFDASPELVLCFIPVESALSAALMADANLLDYAASKNVALVSPVSLLSSLKAISFSWRQDALTDNAKELFTLSKQLYDRLGTAGSHLAAMGKSLGRTVDSYNNLVGSLETRVFVTARKIANLDSAQLTDTLYPQPLDSTAKPITASEFLSEIPQEPATEANVNHEDDLASSAFASYQQIYQNGEVYPESEERDHVLDPKKSAYTPTFENVPLWDQYPDDLPVTDDDFDDDSVIITEHDYTDQIEAARRASIEDEPFDYDSWNS